MECVKCKKQIPDGALYCPWCGKKQAITKRRASKRPNGTGSAYQRGKTWTAAVTIGYELIEQEDGSVKRVARKETKGGFPSRTKALEACASLGKRTKAAIKIPNFIGAYEAWEKEYLTKKRTKSTLNCYRAAKKYFKDIYYFGFQEIGLEDLQQCVDECPNGRRTRENMKALASLMYKYALPRHWTDMNYANYIAPGGEEGGTYPAFSKDQVETIRRSVGKVAHADVIYCLIYTGFRPTEMLGLRKEDYREENGIAYLVAGIKTEAGKGRAVTISPKIRDIIADRIKSEREYIFPKDDGTPMTAKYFRDNYFYPALSEMGIQDVPTEKKPAVYVPYSCRHTFSNFLKNAQGADKDKAALIGHEDYETTKRMYQSAELENMQRITDQF